MKRNAYTDAFRALLQSLNAEQRAAVESIEGPVAVIAGPGTGKTHLMTARVGKILLETDTPPQSILCLTFTDAAVSALRSRLLQVIGPEAYRVPITTFHSFCHRIVQGHPDYFGVSDLEPASELERVEIVRQLLSELPAEHPLRQKHKNAFFYERHLRALFTRMKSENWTPGWVRRCADKYAKELPQHPSFIYQRNTATHRKGQLKTAQIAAEVERMERLKAAADLYPKYLRALAHRRRYEFEDMILWVIRAFEKNEALLRTYQERYLYVQVDEFQDTNGAQYALLQRLLEYWQTPNILIVGDDDQSIYEFQGARLEHLLDFQKRYRQGLTTVVLRQNYRSAQEILDVAARLIDFNSLRATQPNGQPFDKRLCAANTQRGAVVVYRYDTPTAEITDIAAQIQQLLSQGVPPQEIAVIYAQHRQADELQALLARRGIPYQAKRPVDILKIPLIEQFCELLRYLLDEAERPHSAEHRLFRLLHAPFWDIPPADLVTLAARLSTEDAAGQKKAWRLALASVDFLQNLPLRAPQTLINLGQLIDEWIAAVYTKPLPLLLELLFTQTGLLRWAAAQPDSETLLSALKTLLDFATAETRRIREVHPVYEGLSTAPLRYFLQTLQSMAANQIGLPLQQPVSPAAAIQLLTAHAAKGLEFECVFLMDCVEDFWEKTNNGSRNSFALPPNLQPAPEADALEACRRLFYVAMTRAKRLLYVSFARTGADGKPRTASQFIAEAGLSFQDREVDRAEQMKTLALLLHTHNPPPLPKTDIWRPLLADLRLSITSLNRYLRCRRAFFYEDVLKIPAATSEAAAFGLAMHRVLQRFFSQTEVSLSDVPKTLLRFFEAEMERWRHHFSPANFHQRLALGRSILHRLGMECLPHWPKRAVAERRFDRVHVDGVPLTGVIDRIEWLEDGALGIVDFKTGTPDPLKVASPSEQHPFGGEYWRQMAFYRLLLEASQLFTAPIRRTAIQWLELDHNDTLPYVEIGLQPQDLSFVRDLIARTWTQIQAAQFDPGCQKKDCPWCHLYESRSEALPPLDRKADDELDDLS